jgi:predicted nucleic acid-binding protein
MIICLDTDVLIDCLRGLPQARAWLEQHASEPFVVPGIAAMELVMGSQNQTDLKRTQEFLRSFNVVWPEARDFTRAFDLLVTHRLASGLSIPDCLVAAMVLERSWQLYTFNLKHYRVVPTLNIAQPYQRL